MANLTQYSAAACFFILCPVFFWNKSGVDSIINNQGLTYACKTFFQFFCYRRKPPIKTYHYIPVMLKTISFYFFKIIFIDCQWLFYKHMFTRSECLHYILCMGIMRSSNENCINSGIADYILTV